MPWTQIDSPQLHMDEINAERQQRSQERVQISCSGGCGVNDATSKGTCVRSPSRATYRSTRCLLTTAFTPEATAQNTSEPVIVDLEFQLGCC